MREEDRILIHIRMCVKTVDRHSKYLGLPVIFGISKKDIFAMVVEMVWKKMKGWKEKFLSRVGKEVLIKAIAQAILNYVMSCYKLPEGTCHEIESLFSKFWWGTKNGARKIHWLSWDKLSGSIKNGGMRFKEIRSFNSSMLVKKYWRLLTGESSLLSKVLKSRYHPRCDVSDAMVGFSPSYAWRSILSARDVVNSGTRGRIGNDEKVCIWNDH